MNAYDQARQRIDAAHSADPESADDGRPAELVYADRVEAWVLALDPEAPESLRLAARGQHLERWLSPRGDFPQDRAGYLKWRAALYQKQADRALEILLQSGVPESEARDARRWISKTALKTDPGSRMLEDAAVLVFLEHEIGEFASRHADYPREKFLGILRKTWAKISPAARQAAAALPVPPMVAEMLDEIAREDGSDSAP